jgi:hypothetical protein
MLLAEFVGQIRDLALHVDLLLPQPLNQQRLQHFVRRIAVVGDLAARSTCCIRASASARAAVATTSWVLSSPISWATSVTVFALEKPEVSACHFDGLFGFTDILAQFGNTLASHVFVCAVSSGILERQFRYWSAIVAHHTGLFRIFGSEAHTDDAGFVERLDIHQILKLSFSGLGLLR